ncbi:MAG: GTPase RsgA, partial [Bacteroidaceae bacterium]|nr:GTPase RsgA [Bacteroidaceae bacterium]
MASESPVQKGIVIKSTGSWYTVRTDNGGPLVDCKVKGNFRLKGIRSTNPVAVGDRVSIVVNPEGKGFIQEIEDRRNFIVRKASNLSKQSHILASNLDQAVLVVTVAHPETSTVFIDRFLAGAEAYRIPVVLVFNKTDLYSDSDLRYMEAVKRLYESLGYQCVSLSAATGEGCGVLQD